MRELPAPKSTEEQLLLFQTRQLNTGSCRHFTGDFFEDVTAALTGGVRLRTDSRFEICPDILFLNEICFEIKSVGRTGSAIIYDNRTEKDEELIKTHPLFYWFWNHHFKVTTVETLPELYKGLANAYFSTVVVDFKTLHDWCKDKPVKTLNTGLAKNGNKLGYGSRGYGNGWNVPVKEMLQTVRREAVKFGPMTVRGATFPEVSVHFHDSFFEALEQRRQLCFAATMLNGSMT